MTNSGGISLGGAFLILFITLKLCGVVAWSWWWVLCPAWIGFAVLLLIGVIALIVMSGVVVVAAVTAWKMRVDKKK